MAFLAIILVLFIDRVLWDASPYRSHAWFPRYLQRINLSGWFTDKTWGAPVILLPVLALVGWLQTSLVPGLGDLFEFALASGVLLLSLGPRDLGRDIDDYLSARDNDDLDKSSKLAEDMATEMPADPDMDRTVRQALLIGACHRLLGPIVWFVLFGAVGAATYRLARLLNDQLQSQQDASSALARSATTLSHVLAWLPIRLTAAGFAIAGNFDAVVSAWKQHSEDNQHADIANDDSLLVETGEAALGQLSNSPELVQISSTLTLVWRNLTLWVSLLGAITLFQVI